MPKRREVVVNAWSSEADGSLDLWIANARATGIGSVAIHAVLRNPIILEMDSQFYHLVGYLTLFGEKSATGLYANMYLGSTPTDGGHGVIRYSEETQHNALIAALDNIENNSTHQVYCE